MKKYSDNVQICKKTLFQASNRQWLIALIIVFVLLITASIWTFLTRHMAVALFISTFGEIILVAFFIAIIHSVKEINNYNYLVEHGTLVIGKIMTVSAISLKGIKLRTMFVDEETGEQYIYVTEDCKIVDSCKIRQFVKENPQIEMLIDANNMRNGVALIQRYCAKMDEAFENL